MSSFLPEELVHRADGLVVPMFTVSSDNLENRDRFRERWNGWLLAVMRYNPEFVSDSAGQTPGVTSSLFKAIGEDALRNVTIMHQSQKRTTFFFTQNEDNLLVSMNPKHGLEDQSYYSDATIHTATRRMGIQYSQIERQTDWYDDNRSTAARIVECLSKDAVDNTGRNL